MWFQKYSVRRISRKGYFVKAMKQFFPAGKAMYLRRNEPAAAMCLRRDFCPI